MPTTFGKLTGGPFVPKFEDPNLNSYKMAYQLKTDPPTTREELSKVVDYATEADMPPPDVTAEVAASLLSRLEKDAERRAREEEMMRRSCLEFAIKYEGADDKPADVVARAGTYYNFVKNGLPDPEAM